MSALLPNEAQYKFVLDHCCMHEKKKCTYLIRIALFILTHTHKHTRMLIYRRINTETPIHQRE